MLAVLAVFVLAAFALTTSTGAPLTSPGDATLGASGPFATCDGAAHNDVTAPTGAASQPDGSDAACRRAPECWTDSDCDVQCGGVGLGKCVHSNCPVRICKCR
jgi:hypothetical protein